MSDCPWRYLTADGRTVRCTGHGDAHWTDVWPNGIPMVDHARDDWPHILGWEEDDPCAWDATCTNCEGDGWVDTGGDPGYDTKTCPPCGGAGTVDTIPRRLIGVGSVYRWTGEVPHEDIVVAGEGDRVRLWCPNAETAQSTELTDNYTLVRAVPPAGDTT